MEASLELYLEAFGAVCVQGPKSCGKTWFSLNSANSAFMLADPKNNYQNRKLADLDLDIVFRGESPHLIDEWQEIPEIWDAARMKIDETGTKGQYILTGSSTPSKKGILHSGAGRMGILKLRTMSLFESGDSSGAVSLKSLFEGMPVTLDTGSVDIDTLVRLTVRGGWPQLLSVSENAAALAVRGYVDLLLEDARTMDGVMRDSAKLRRVFRSLARNESTLAKLSTLASDTSELLNDGSAEFSRDTVLNDRTVREYLDVFSRLFLIEDQPAYDPHLKSSVRVGKAPKRHFTDPSLAVAALGLTPQQLKGNPDVFGYYFEALCERDLAIYAEVLGGSLYHYRDLYNREVDAVLELPDGRFGLFEIKLGVKEIDDAAKNLLRIVDYWKLNELSRDPSVLCVICGMSGAAYRRPDGVYVVPITALRP